MYLLLFLLCLSSFYKLWSLDLQEFEIMRKTRTWKNFKWTWKPSLHKVMSKLHYEDSCLSRQDKVLRMFMINRLNHLFSTNKGLDFLQYCSRVSAYDVIKTREWKKFKQLNFQLVKQTIERANILFYQLDDDEYDSRQEVLDFFDSQGFDQEESMKALKYFYAVSEHKRL